MNTISDFNFANKRAIIRVDYNVPLDATFAITDDTRIRATLPTLHKILGDGGSIVLMSHLGRPKDGPSEKYSLKHLVGHLSSLLGKPVQFAADCISEEARQKAFALKPGEVLLLENVRFYKEEEKGDEAFARKLAEMGEVYVNDAFGTAHRAHASTAVMARFFPGKKYFGYVMGAEVESASRVMKQAQKPFVAVMGGAKVSDKILIIENLLNTCSSMIIGGGMAFTFLKAQGKPIGKSICEEDRLLLAAELLEKARNKGVHILLPVDFVVADAFSNEAQTQVVSDAHIPDGWMGLDIGPASISLFHEEIMKAKTILWNGPMGVFEMEKFQQGTVSVARSCAASTDQGAYSLIGGGDSVAAINKFHLSDKVSYVSTGGGALLEFIEGKELPGIAAVME